MNWAMCLFNGGKWASRWEETGLPTSDISVCVRWKWSYLWREVLLFMTRHTQRKWWPGNFSLTGDRGHFKWVGERERREGWRTWGKTAIWTSWNFYWAFAFSRLSCSVGFNWSYFCLHTFHTLCMHSESLVSVCSLRGIKDKTPKETFIIIFNLKLSSLFNDYYKNDLQLTLAQSTHGMTESGKNPLINYAYKSICWFQMSSLCQLRQPNKTAFVPQFPRVNCFACNAKIFHS